MLTKFKKLKPMCSRGSKLHRFIYLYFLSVYLSFIFPFKGYCEAVQLQKLTSQVASTITTRKHDFRGHAAIENQFMSNWDEYGHFITHFMCGRQFIKTPGEVSSVNRLQSLQPMKEHLEAIRFPSFPVMFLWQAHRRHVFWTHGTHTFQITGACQTFRQT